MILNIFGFKKKKVMGCKGVNCPEKNACVKHKNYTSNNYTTFYERTQYNHIDKKCTSFEEEK